MAWKRDAFELATRFCAMLAPRSAAPPAEPRSIFVLRNNDLGDVLVVTPLFEALRRRFPSAKIVAGIGDWAAPVLAGNPHVDETLPVNAAEAAGRRAARFEPLGHTPGTLDPPPPRRGGEYPRTLDLRRPA